MYFFKLIKIIFFNLIYGKISKILLKKNSSKIKIKKVFVDKKYSYKIYILSNSRNYQGSVHDNAVVIDNHVFANASYQYRYNKNRLIENGSIKKNIIFKEGTAKFKKRINGNVFSLLTGGAGKENYFHWLFDVIPRIAILEKSGLKLKNLKFLLPSLKFRFQKETIKSLKLAERNCFDSRNFKHFLADKIIVTDHPYVLKNNPTSSILDLPIWIILWLRKKFIKQKTKRERTFSKIYIDRSDSKFSKERHIVNENEVKKCLIKNGFKSVILSKISFKKQVSIFNNAKVIVGLHGAGFANIVFSKKKTEIVELQSMYSGDIYKSLAKKCGIKYSRIISKYSPNKSSNPHGKIFININLLKRKLRLS